MEQAKNLRYKKVVNLLQGWPTRSPMHERVMCPTVLDFFSYDLFRKLAYAL